MWGQPKDTIITFRNRRTLESQNHTVTEQENHSSTQSQNHRIILKWNHGITESKTEPQNTPYWRGPTHITVPGPHSGIVPGLCAGGAAAAAHAFAALLPSGCISTSSVSPCSAQQYRELLWGQIYVF